MVNNMIRVLKYLVILLVFMTFKSNVVFAMECSSKELDSLKELAKKVDITYNIYNEEDKTFEINVINLNKYLYIYDFVLGNEITYKNSNIYTYYAKISNTRYNYNIYASNKTNCARKLLLEKGFFVPKTNPFYNDDLCQGVEDFYLCDFWYPLDITYYDFQKKVLKYKEEKKDEKKEKDKIENNKDDYINIIYRFITNNYTYLLMGIILLGSSLILIIKRIQKRGDII